MNEKSENRKALPRFTLSLLGSLLVGGVIGFAVGLSRAMGLDTAALAEGLSAALAAVTPWGIPVTSALTLGSCLVLYRSHGGGIIPPLNLADGLPGDPRKAPQLLLVDPQAGNSPPGTAGTRTKPRSPSTPP